MMVSELLSDSEAPSSKTGEPSTVGVLQSCPVRRINRCSPVWAAAATALLLGTLWARYLAGVGGDLAAQWAWADFAARYPGSAYDLAWYGGAYPASYSLLTPYLMGFLGVRTLAVAAATASAALLALLLQRSPLDRPLPVALWGAFALTCNIVAGRVTFALGLAFGLAAVATATVPATADGAQQRPGWPRTAGAAVLALLATSSSPVAGLFVVTVAAALLLTGRYRSGWALALPPPLLVLVTALLFPFDGVDPMEASTAVFCLTCAAAVALLSPRDWRTVRTAAAVYALGTVLTWALSTPIGSNVQRLALIFGSVILLAALSARTARPGPRTLRELAVPLTAFAAAAFWLVNGDLLGEAAPSPPHKATGLTAELGRLHADRGRLEAVPMRNHWESWGLVSSADLARGWNRQLDLQRNPLFYQGTLTPASYHAWLQYWAVRYVALSTGAADTAAIDEAALVRKRPDWLQEIWHDADWRLYRLTDPLPLAAPPATVDHADAADVQLTLARAARVLVRVPWSTWLAVHGPAGARLAPDGDWTRLDAPAPGSYRIDAPYR